MRRTSALVALLALSALAVAGLGPAAGAQSGTGTVTVIHGVPGVDVDVYVDGEVALEGFTPETVTDPIELPAGDHQVDIRPAGADPADDPIISGSASLPAGANATLIAHLTADGTPTLSAFVNDTSPTAAGEGRLVVRHTAAAPAVDVLSDGTAVVSGLANPDEATLDLPAGTVPAAVAAAGTTEPVIGPVDVPVVAGQVTTVYAIGSLEDDTLGAVVQTITVGEEQAPTDDTTPDEVPVPDGVPAGGSGDAADRGPAFPTTAALVVAGGALLALALSVRSLAAARGRA